MNTQGAKCSLGRSDAPYLVRHTNVPQLDLTIAAPTDQFSHTATLHMDVRDPLLMAAVAAYHRFRGLLALIKDLDLAVAESGDKNVASNLIGSQSSDTRI